jgi:hypothetical protein
LRNNTGTLTQNSSLSQRRTVRWPAYAACAWAFLFAALSFFWAAGGRTGLHPLESQETSDSFLWVAVNLGAGMAKLVLGLIALAFVQRRGSKIPHKLLLVVTWIVGVGMVLYGGLGLISDVLHVTGVINDPQSWKWFFLYLVLWDPWWVLGGVLYIATALFSSRYQKFKNNSDKTKQVAAQQP